MRTGLPHIGFACFPGTERAYTYLGDSIEAFPEGARFTAVLDKVGYRDTAHKPGDDPGDMQHLYGR